MIPILQPHAYSGKLIVLEGVDGAGKTTQLDLLSNWLTAEGYAVNYTRRRTSKLVAKSIERAKEQRTLTSVTYSLIHSADFADRLENDIIPALKAGIIVLADEYVYTSFARDVARGNDRDWVRKMYSFAIRPDITFYLKISSEVSLQRVSSIIKNLEWYSAGLDLDIDPDPRVSFQMFQNRVIQEYDNMVDEFNFKVLDGTKLIHEIQLELRKIVREILTKDSEPVKI